MTIHNISFPNNIIDDNFNVRLILPKQYDDKKKFPVLYVNDGNFLFPSRGKKPNNSILYENYYNDFYNFLPQIIIVAIDSPRNSSVRTSLFVPYTQKPEDLKQGDIRIIGMGKNYSNFIVKEIKPYVDKNFNTLSDKHNTGICGFSSGAFNALYTSFVYSDVFSKLVCISPAVYKWIDEINQLFLNNKINHLDHIYLDVGDKEEDKYTYGLGFLGGTRHIHSLIEKNMNKDINVLFHIAQGHTHEIFNWRDRFFNGIRFIYNDY